MEETHEIDSRPNAHDSLRHMLDSESPLQLKRAHTALALRDTLEAVKDRLGYWETANIAHAIAALAWNVRSAQQEYDGWLRLSLVSAELAMASPATRNDNYSVKDKKIDSFTYSDLQKAIDLLVLECGAQSKLQS